MKYDTKRRPHHDLENVVDYQLIRIRERLEKGDVAGINHDMTACLEGVQNSVSASHKSM